MKCVNLKPTSTRCDRGSCCSNLPESSRTAGDGQLELQGSTFSLPGLWQQRMLAESIVWAKEKQHRPRGGERPPLHHRGLQK